MPSANLSCWTRDGRFHIQRRTPEGELVISMSQKEMIWLYFEMWTLAMDMWGMNLNEQEPQTNR